MTTFHEPDQARISPVRASDAEREAAVARLHVALGEGRLDLAEAEVRVAAVYAARHRSDLPPLLADLPQSAGARAPAWGDHWTATVWAARNALLGDARTGVAGPTAAQCRSAAWAVALTVLWMVTCAVIGAAVVGS